jgi:hypothetical protein
MRQHYAQIEKDETFHRDGLRSYVSTLAVLRPESAHLFPQRTEDPYGICRIRIGTTSKNDKDGNLVWSQDYDDMGKCIACYRRARLD